MSFFSSTSSGFSSSRRNPRRSPQEAGYAGLRLNSDLDQLQSSYRPYQDDPDSGEDLDTESGPPPPPLALQPSSRTGLRSTDNWPSMRGGGDRDDGGGPPDPSGVFIHTVPESSKSRWSHIDDLDSFFKKVYSYHQKHGFQVMMLQVSKINTYIYLAGTKTKTIASSDPILGSYQFLLAQRSDIEA